MKNFTDLTGKKANRNRRGTGTLPWYGRGTDGGWC